MRNKAIISQRTVVSTFASPHEQTLKPKACKRASASPAHVTAFQDGFRIAHAQKNKINLCFVAMTVQFDRTRHELNR
ncbi:MAG TPA: hypothetical protein DCR40_11710 [Prolixibacteraceae bacterium]|nr:hypothetical protein [Prolixibacteraceae bacterium]